MKIQIIQLDKHDDVLSIRDKINWAKSPRILLVWPESGRLLFRRLDLVILQRGSNQVGAQLGLVTRDQEVTANASEVGIPVFRSISGAQKSYWKHARKPGPLLADRKPPQNLRLLLENNLEPAGQSWLENRWLKGFSFSLALLCISALVAAFFPSADIKLFPRSQTQTVEIPIVASSQVKSINLTGNLPAHSLTIIVEGQDHVETTGQVSVPERKAVGIMRFSNLSDQVVEVPAGLIVRTKALPETRYMTLNGGKVEAGTGRMLDIPAEAITPGEEGNQSDNAVNAIEGPLGLKLSVTNPYAMTNGSSNLSLAVSQADYEKLNQRLVKSLQEQALLEMTKQLSSDDRLIPETISLKTLLDEKHFPEIGQSADSLNLSLREEFSGMVIAGSDIRALATAALDTNLPDTSLPRPNSLIITAIDKPVLDEAGIHWHLKAERQIVSKLSEDQVITFSKGLSPNDASASLYKQFKLTTLPSIHISPGWWPRLPIFPFRITVELAGMS